MAPELKAADCTQRLADQLQTLSEVAEILTFRLLELEERLAGHELWLEPLLAGGLASGGPLAEGTELRLVETEDRLARLETLLKGVAAQVPHQDEPFAEEEPFLDDHEFERPNFERQEFGRPQFGHQRFERDQVEGQQAERHQVEHEQRFMDELSA
jgi:hypothetical protein